MPVLELLCSPPGTGKTTHCIDVFTDKVLESPAGLDSRSFFILPSREHAERIQNQILKRNVPGLFNAHVLTMDDFMERVLPAARRAGRPTDTVRKKILRGLLQEEEKAYPYFERVKTFAGFQDLLIDTIKECKEAALGAREFERRCRVLLKDGVFRLKFRDFTRLVNAYEAELRKLGFEEPQDGARRILRTRSCAPAADLVVLDGFYHFTRLQRDFIAFLRGRVSRIMATLTLPLNHAARMHVFSYPAETARFLKGLGFRESRVLGGENHRTRAASLRHLEENLFLEKPRVLTDAGAEMVIFEASTVRGEAEMIAREIKRLYRETPLHYSDVCVILRNIGGYRPLLRSVFSEFGIPVVVHEREKLVEQGLGMLLGRFLSLLEEDWPREHLFYLLKSNYLNRTTAAGAVSSIETAAFRDNIVGGRGLWKGLSSSSKLSTEGRAPLEKLFAWERALLGAETIHAFMRELTVLLNEWRLPPAEAPGAGAADAEVIRAVTDGLQNARKFYGRSGSKSFSAAAFVREFRDSLHSILFSLRPAGRNRVQVYDAVMAIPKEYKVVFIAGLLENTFPRAAAEDPLFKDAERRVINRGETLLEERRRRETGERYFFYMAVGRAGERLYLTYPKYDTEGRPALRSFFVEEAEKCFRAVRRVEKESADLVPGWEEWETEHEMVEGLAEILFAPQNAPLPGPLALPAPVFSALQTYRDHEALRETLRVGFSGPEASIRDERVRRDFAKTAGPFSATRLETFATCAFKYFAERVLSLRPPLEGREFLEMGSLLHKVLEEFYSGLPEAGRKVWEEEGLADERLQQGLSRALEQSAFTYLPLYRRRVYETRMRRALRLFVEEEKRYVAGRRLVPAYFEYAFRGLRLRDGAEEIEIEGKIDRVDVDAESRKALVIDYKLSKRPVSLRRKFSKGLELQIPLYLLAAERLLGFEVLGGELRFLSTASSDGLYRESERGALMLPPRRNGLSEEEFRALLSETERLVWQIVRRLRAADISVRSKSCDYCPFSPVCRFEARRWVRLE